MKITILAIGKKHDPKLLSAIEDYTSRLQHYCPTKWNLLEAKTSSSMKPDEIKKLESELLLSHVKSDDKLILLDEIGKQLNSIQNSQALQKHLNNATKNLVFIIGGSYGVRDGVKERANFIWSLSPLVFPHQLVRLILIEQLYRGFTVLAGEQYHHV